MFINSEYIFKALDFFSKKGYMMHSVPFVVSPESSNCTKPKGVGDLYHEDKVYVASAEQGFIELHKNGQLSPGKYLAISPCYRDEAVIDDLHLNIFLKIELIHVGATNFLHIVNDVSAFIRTVEPNVSYSTCTQFYGASSMDIEVQCGTSEFIEYGSYGTRKFLNGESYAYGTGLAEPRFSTIVEKHKIFKG